MVPLPPPLRRRVTRAPAPGWGRATFGVAPPSQRVVRAARPGGRGHRARARGGRLAAGNPPARTVRAVIRVSWTVSHGTRLDERAPRCRRSREPYVIRLLRGHIDVRQPTGGRRGPLAGSREGRSSGRSVRGGVPYPRSGGRDPRGHSPHLGGSRPLRRPVASSARSFAGRGSGSAQVTRGDDAERVPCLPGQRGRYAAERNVGQVGNRAVDWP